MSDEVLLHFRGNKRSDFEENIWLRAEIKTLIAKNKKLVNMNNTLQRTRSSKKVREELKLAKQENIRLLKINSELNKKLDLLNEKTNLKSSEFKTGDRIKFLYNNDIVEATIKCLHKNFVTVFSFKDRNDGFRVKYSDIIK